MRGFARRLRSKRAVLAAGALLLLVAWGWFHSRLNSTSAPVDPYAGPSLPEATFEQVLTACTACHVYPPPEAFARYDWPGEVSRGFRFLERAGLTTIANLPAEVEVTRYYTNRAPLTLPPAERTPAASPGQSRFQFQNRGYRGDEPGAPAIAGVGFAHLFDDHRLDVLACDMAGGRVLAFKPYEKAPRPIVLAGGLKDPCRAEVVDLDRDGVKDVLVAVLGNRWPTDDRVGSVVWLRGNRSGGFTSHALAEGLGRTADAQAADFDGDGDLDVVVAVFGYLNAGEILYLENQTTDPARPVFVPHQLDSRHGAVHVPVADLNNDGHPDFVALITQEHEVVEAFLNDGSGRFNERTIYKAPHPAFSSSGIQLVDMDRDGDLDVLLTNGDAMDRKYFKPYHGIQWLENQGEFPFLPHQVDFLDGVARAMAGDLDGDGDLDILATSFLPGGYWDRQRTSHKLDSIVLYEQTKPGEFLRRTLETVTCNHPSCDLGDYDGDGRLDFVISNCFFTDEFGEVPPPDGLDWIVIGRGMEPARP